MNDDLPKLSAKQHACLERYFSNRYNKTEAYRFAYNCENMKPENISVEANRFFKNPKITPWLDFYRSNVSKVTEDEIKYSALDFFDECNELKEIALNCFDKYGNACS